MFQKLPKRLSRELRRSSIPYMVIGGQAVLLYGESRLTRDIDMTLGIGTDGLETLMRVVSALHLEVLAEDAKDFVGRTMVLPTIGQESGIRNSSAAIAEMESP